MLVPLASGVNATLVNAAGGIVGIGSVLLALSWWRHLVR